MNCGPWPIWLRFVGTVFQHVFSRLDFWLFFLLHVGIYCFHRIGLLHCAAWPSEMHGSGMKIITATTIIFSLFCLHLCFKRCLRLQEQVDAMLSSVIGYAVQARVYLQQTSCDTLSARWVVSSLLLFSFEARTGKYHNGSVSAETWELLVDWGFLERAEVRDLQDLTSQQRLLVMVHTATDMVRCGLSSARLPVDVLNSMVAQLLSYKDLQCEVYGILNTPFPLVYLQLLSAMVVVTMFIWAYLAATACSGWASGLYFVTDFFMLGMLDTASRLADPGMTGAFDLKLAQRLTSSLASVEAALSYEDDAMRALGGGMRGAAETKLDLVVANLGEILSSKG